NWPTTRCRSNTYICRPCLATPPAKFSRPRYGRCRPERWLSLMSEHRATVVWKRTGDDFLRGKYSREHTWSFDGGATVPASSSPSAVPVPWSNPAHIDPEEAFVASIASCHMLTFLWLASKARFQVDAYEDTAVGELAKTAAGTLWVSAV